MRFEVVVFILLSLISRPSWMTLLSDWGRPRQVPRCERGCLVRSVQFQRT
jgi:hypothetical protein